jgi:hypothetical protein
VNALQLSLILAVRAYRLVLSPILAALFAPLGFGCRFTPTCSGYALEALQTHGAVQGAALAARRLCRCHPWGGSGPDPVPGIELGMAANAIPLPLPARHEWGEGRGEGNSRKNGPPLPSPLLLRREEREKLQQGPELKLNVAAASSHGS